MMYYLIFLYIFCVCTNVEAILNEYRAVRAYDAGDLEGAQQLLEPLFVHQQHDAQIAYNLGKIAYKKNAFAQAEVYLQRATQHAQDPQLQLQSYFDLGNAQVQQKKWHEALASYQDVIARDPEHKEALDMIEQIKKILQNQQQQEEQKKNQQKNQQNNNQNDNKRDQNNSNDNNEQKNQNDKNDSSQNKQNKNNPSQEQNNQENQEQKEKNNQKQQQGQNQGENSSQTNKEQGSQERDNQTPENDFGNDKGEKEREQKREEHKQNEQKQQPQGQGDLPPDKVGDNHGQGKENESSNHEKPSPLAPPQASSQNTMQPQKEQDSKNKPTDKEELLLSLLEEKDAQLIKKMLKAQVMQEMPRTHGQKNW